MKIGLFGGTFNPFHNGHLVLLKHVRDALSLDRVIVIPAAQPPHKDSAPVIESFHRVEMCRLATDGIENVEISDIELKREGPSYTVDTLIEMKALYPGDELFLITGSDSFLSIESWYRANEIFSLATVVGAPRVKADAEKLLEKQRSYAEKGYRTVVVADIEPVEISSTECRAGESSELCEAVEDYIVQNGLYGRDIYIPVDLDEITAYLREHLSPKRFAHTLNVANEALRLAQTYEQDGHLAYLAGLLHDVCKELPKDEQWAMLEGTPETADSAFQHSPSAWHGYAAAIFVRREFSVCNVEILNAVRYHTTGREAMSRLEEILYMADLVCADRSYPGVDALRAKTYRSLEEALLEAFAFALGDLSKNSRPVLVETVKAYNRYVSAVSAKGEEA